MAVQLVAFEDITESRMKSGFDHNIVDRASNLERWIKLKKRLGPEFALAQLGFDHVTDFRIRNLEEASDVTLVIRDDAGVGFEDIHENCRETL